MEPKDVLSSRTIRGLTISETHEYRGEPCWEWKIPYHRSRRLFYERTVGPIPPGFVLDHLCRNPLCIHPLHQEPVTQRVNLQRAPTSIPAINASKTHCKNGHEFTEENTLWYSGRKGIPYRNCRTCRAHKTVNLEQREEVRALALALAAGRSATR